MPLDELLHERTLFIAYEAAFMVAGDIVAPWEHPPADPIRLMMFVAQKSALALAAGHKVIHMRQAGVL